MKKIVIISSSVRDGRLSHRGALYLDRLVRETGMAECRILDLKEYNFPLFHERWGRMATPPAGLDEFAAAITSADGVVIVTPVYNGSFAAAAKNVIDVFYREWYHKPVTIYSGTYTPTPGIAAVQQLQSILLKLGALVAPALGTFINLATELDQDGTPAHPDLLAPVMRPPLDELMWLMERK